MAEACPGLCMCTCARVYLCVHMCVYLRVCTCMCVHVCACTHVCAHMSVCPCACREQEGMESEEDGKRAICGRPHSNST